MATTAELEELRRLVPPGEWDDAVLLALIDERNVDGALAHLWDVQAAKTANLADVTESGSSRKLSQAHDHAVKMAKEYGARVTAVVVATTAGTARTRNITR